jgi:glycosyltransferase involved in cell wall biosynthesis
MRRLHVVTLVDRAFWGGAERLALEIATRLDQRRFESTLCVSRWPSDDDADEGVEAATRLARSAGIDLLKLRRRRGRLDALGWRPLLALLREGHVDVLHAHMFGSNVWGTLLGRASRVPVVIAHEHGWSFEGNRMRRLLDRHLIARGADAFIAVSRENRRLMIATEKLRPEDVVLIPSGVPDRRPSHGDLRDELGIAPGDPVVASVCVLRAEKALDVLVGAAELLRADLPRLRVLIAGDGPERAALQSSIARHSLQATVTLLGMRSDVPDVLAAADVAVCCSDWEGSPLAVMEYMAARKAIVATRVGGVPDLIDDGVHGILVPPRAPAALAEAVARLLDDRQLAAQMGAHARERQQREFDMDVMVRRLERLYQELCAASRRGTRA